MNDVSKYFSPALITAARAGEAKCVDLLLKAGADICERDLFRTLKALDSAAVNGHHKSVKLLLKAGADVNAFYHKGFGHTALHAAVDYRGHSICLRELIEAGADVNAVDCFGNPPLFTACGNNLSVRLLLLARASVNMVNNRCQDILTYYTYHRNPSPEQLYELTELIQTCLFKVVEKFVEDGSGENGIDFGNLCRKAILKRLRSINPQLNMLSKVLKLRLPPPLASYLIHQKVTPEEIRTLLRDSEKKSTIGST